MKNINLQILKMMLVKKWLDIIELGQRQILYGKREIVFIILPGRDIISSVHKNVHLYGTVDLILGDLDE